MIRVLFTGGGTAGHVIPALPIIRALHDEGAEIGFVGTHSGLEEDLLRDQTATFYAISAGKLRRYVTLDNLRDAFRVLRGVWDAYRVVGEFRPDVVFSKGGFVSFPVVFAAWLRHVPVVAHESDLTPGLANRLALPFVRTLCVNFPSTHPGRFKGRLVHTGTPVRAALQQGDANRGRRLLGIDAERPMLLVTGGSLGADAVNAVVRENLDALLTRYFVVHVCGPGKRADTVAEGYRQYEYVRDEWGDLLAAADIVVSRAGANTLYELLSLRKPNLLVPLSRKASRGDQLENAAYAESEGFSRVIQEEDFTGARLLEELRTLEQDLAGARARLHSFEVPDSVPLLVQEIESLARD